MLVLWKEKLAEVGVRTLSLVISTSKWRTDKKGQSESPAVGTKKPLLGHMFPLPLFSKNLDGQGISKTFNSAPWPPSSGGTSTGVRERQFYETLLWQTNIFQETALKYWEREKKEERGAYPTWTNIEPPLHMLPPANTCPTGVVLKLGHRVIWPSSHQDVGSVCFPSLWAGSEARSEKAMQLLSGMSWKLALSGPLLESSHHVVRSLSYMERPWVGAAESRFQAPKRFQPSWAPQG